MVEAITRNMRNLKELCVGKKELDVGNNNVTD